MSYNDPKKERDDLDTIVPTSEEKNVTTAHFETMDDDLKGERRIGGIAINSHMTAEERSTAMRLANEMDPGPALFSWRYISFLLTCLCVILNSGDSGMSLLSTRTSHVQVPCADSTQGYDPTIMSSVNSMTQFHDFFGLEQASTGTGVVFVSPSQTLFGDQRHGCFY